MLVQESTSNEDDVFDVYQVLWNCDRHATPLHRRALGLNKIFFPTYLNGNDQTLLDTATNIRTRNFTSGTERWRDRYQANATGQYYLDEALGGRHEFKFGFDHSHMPVEKPGARFDDVELPYSSATGLSQNVTLYGTPFFSKTAVDVTALYAQDSYSIKNLTVTGGVALGASRRLSARAKQPGQPLLPEPAALVPRGARHRQLEDDRPAHQRAPTTCFGNGRTALKASAGRYYYVIASGGGARYRQSKRQLPGAVCLERRERRPALPAR